MKNSIYSSVLKLALAVVAPVLCASAQTGNQVVLRQGLDGYTGTSSNIVIAGSNFETKNFGGAASFLVGAAESNQRRALLRFDLTQFAGQTVLGDAILKLRQVNTGSAVGTYQINVFQVSAANADWVAGVGNDTAALPGESAWSFKAKGEDGEANTGWAGSAGLRVEGVDYVATAVATITYNTVNNNTWVELTIPQELIQLWIDNPQANGGFLLARADFENSILGGFRSESYSNASQRPELSFAVAVPEHSAMALTLGGAVTAAAVLVALRRRARR